MANFGNCKSINILEAKLVSKGLSVIKHEWLGSNSSLEVESDAIDVIKVVFRKESSP